MEKEFKKILTMIGEDPNRDGLKDTPKRASEALKFLTRGYDMCEKKVLNDALFDCNNEEMVVVKSIELYSLCEHHLLPFHGVCHIGYLPRKKVIGLSKMGRYVDMFARRLQVQERLTYQIMESIANVTNASGVIVMIEASHMCMMMRGVQKQSSETVSIAACGEFKGNSALRAEFDRVVSSR